MNDQVTTLMEALRLSKAEIEKFRRRKQGLQATVEAVEHILGNPHVKRAVEGLEPFVESPATVPRLPDGERV
jgi:hypothetical protein